MDEVDDVHLADADVYVRLEHQVVGGTSPAPAGIGVIERTGSEAESYLGRRVLVPAVIPASEERDAPLTANRQPDDDDVALWAQLRCPARWILPLEDGLELPAAAAVCGADLASAYALVVAANTLPRAPMLIVGATATAELVARVASGRNVTIEHLRSPADTPRFEGSDRVFVVIADASPELSAAACALVQSLDRPSVAVLAGVAAANLDLATIASRGTTVVGVPGAHPDLLAEIAALVVKGQIELDDLVTVQTTSDELGDGLAVVALD
jgi:hypothetical protein